ncbi:MAG: DUF799 domain-containing protein [Succinivibrio sp.]|nr:DUF799 domain-containing protein [Succinivibrio sp.]MCI7772760.1 DUF799 domain-containing protein [Succinivibrio sp.]MCI7785129.1 DUF799 domain-containing protein [Succinivibrio sp.]
MKLISIFTLFIASSALLFGCKSPEIYDYSEYLKSNPQTILVVMPSSQSNDTNAGPSVLANSIIPLSEAGYYVIPATVANDTFKFNGVTIADEIHNIPHAKLKEIFGADACLYLNILKYDNEYGVLDSETIVQVQGKLVDLETGKTIWEQNTFATNKDSSSGGLIEKMLSSVIKHIINNITDQGYEVAKKNQIFMLSPNNFSTAPILYGPKSPYYRKDIVLKK